MTLDRVVVVCLSLSATMASEAVTSTALEDQLCNHRTTSFQNPKEASPCLLISF